MFLCHKFQHSEAQKPAYFIKADKDNLLVVMDKGNYENGMKDKPKNAPYRRNRTDSAPQLVKEIGRLRFLIIVVIRQPLLTNNGKRRLLYL